MQSNTTAGGKLYRVGQKVVGYLPYAQRVAFKITVKCRVCLTNQLQLFSAGKWCEAHFNFVKQVSGIKRDVIHFGLVEVQAVEIEQICHQLQQVFRRAFHVFQIERLPIVGNKSGKQIGVSHNGTQRCFEIMCNGQHHLLARFEQFARPFIGFLQLFSVTVTTGDVAPNECKEDDRQQYSPQRYKTDGLYGALPHLAPQLCLLQTSFADFLFQAFDQAVYPHAQYAVCLLKQ